MQNKSDLDILISMKSTYEDQIKRLKQDKKDGKVCDRFYKIQLNLWQKRVKEYEDMIQREGQANGNITV
jgi:hypothetical protein